MLRPSFLGGALLARVISLGSIRRAMIPPIGDCLVSTAQKDR